MLVNVLGSALCVSTVGVQHADQVRELAVVPTALTALGWGLAQWWVLLRSGLAIRPWWSAASAAGWLASLPLMVTAIGFVPSSTREIATFASDFAAIGPPSLRMLSGYLVTLVMPAFFGLLGSIPF